MKTEKHVSLPHTALLLAAFALLAAGSVLAQVPVDESGQPLEAEALDETVGAAAPEIADEAPVYTDDELEALVGPIALYPDDLLAIVLPASTYPLEIVQAARFLEELEDDSSLKPDESWDDSVVALLNYPEVVEMMNEDLDWTWQLGEAVVAQQPDVIAAIERFRDRAYAAGNLKSDGYQKVERNDEGALEIETVEDEIIYVPYYEPERVVVHQPRPVYFYYPQPYPVYYYPYPAHYRFGHDYFWGVTTAFRIGWASHHLHVFHHTYWGHPYYGRRYFGHWYRQPSISIYNSYYVNHHLRRPRHHHRDGDFWRPRRIGGPRPGHYRERVARYREPRLERTREGYRDERRGAGSRQQIRRDSDVARRLDSRSGFRGEAARRGTAESANERRGFAASRERTERRAASGDDPIRFLPRQRSSAVSSPRSTNRRGVESRGATRSRQATPAARATRDRSRANDVSRRTDQPARASRSPETRSAPRITAPRRADTPRRSAPSPRTARPSPSQRAAPPRASAPRSSAPRRAAPRASAPRSSAPRASAPRASAPRQSSSRSAPARQSRSAPSRRSGGAGSRNGARTRQH